MPDASQGRNWLLSTYVSSNKNAACFCKNPIGCTGVLILNDDAELSTTGIELMTYK